MQIKTDSSALYTKNHLSQQWLLWLSALLALYVTLPWLAPIFMKLGWAQGGEWIYSLYRFFCHQLPQRSFFLFGTKTMYSLEEIQNVWQNSNNPLILRQFTGNAAMGWKVAWSDRMVWMYSSPLLFGLLYARRRQSPKPIAWWLFALLLLPMAVDGGTHLISDLIAGIDQNFGQGFRDHNRWLAQLTNYRYSATFYAGDALGSFNFIMRMLTGLLFGLGVVTFIYPHLEILLSDNGRSSAKHPSFPQ